MKEIDICEYLKTRQEDDVLLDIRESDVFNFGSIEGAVNIPMDSIRTLYSLPKDKKIYVFCQAGEISAEIVELLEDAGYEAYNLQGGFRKYLLESIK